VGSGQAGGQVATNALAPYAAQLIGNAFDSNHGNNPNQAAQILSHAVLGAVLAYANGGNAATGAMVGGGSEAAAQYLIRELYPQAIDENGVFSRAALNETQAQNIVALTNAIGAVVGGMGSGLNGGTTTDVLANAAVDANVAKNVVENNYLNPDQLIAKRNDLQSCGVGFVSASQYKTCITNVNAAWDKVSLEQDIKLNEDCKNNPNGTNCKANTPIALEYVGRDRNDPAKSSDIATSMKKVLDTALNNSYGSINSIGSRADFFGAMGAYTNQEWFFAAENVSRKDLGTGTFQISSYAFSPNNYSLVQWREAAGNVIMSDNQAAFQWIYQNRFNQNANALGTNGIKNWSLYQISHEQNDPNLQNVHEQYYSQWSYPLQQLINQQAGGNFLDPSIRVNKGVTEMNKVNNGR
jgi:filamentous hemagglutinin